MQSSLASNFLMPTEAFVLVLLATLVTFFVVAGGLFWFLARRRGTASHL